jgi:hypothetical protein
VAAAAGGLVNSTPQEWLCTADFALIWWYASQRRGARSRRYLQAFKLRLRLNGIANLREPFPSRPKRIHSKTYARLRGLGERLEGDLRDNPRFLDRETDYGCLPPVSNKTKVIFCPLCLRLHSLYQRDQTLTEFAPHPNLS